MGMQHQFQFPDFIENFRVGGGTGIQPRHFPRQDINALLKIHQVRKGGHGFINQSAPADMNSFLGQVTHLGMPGFDNGAGIRFIQTGDALHQRGFPRAVMAREGNSFPILHCKGKVIEQDARAILHTQVLNRQNHVLKKQREENSGTGAPAPRSAE